MMISRDTKWHFQNFLSRLVITHVLCNAILEPCSSAALLSTIYSNNNTNRSTQPQSKCRKKKMKNCIFKVNFGKLEIYAHHWVTFATFLLHCGKTGATFALPSSSGQLSRLKRVHCCKGFSLLVTDNIAASESILEGCRVPLFPKIYFKPLKKRSGQLPFVYFPSLSPCDSEQLK